MYSAYSIQYQENMLMDDEMDKKTEFRRMRPAWGEISWRYFDPPTFILESVHCESCHYIFKQFTRVSRSQETHWSR